MKSPNRSSREKLLFKLFAVSCFAGGTSLCYADSLDKSNSSRIVAQATPAISSAQADKTARASVIASNLARAGFQSEVDSDGDIKFVYQSGTYYIIIDGDKQFFRLVYPNFWRVESEVEREQMRTAAEIANARTKVAKITLTRENVWASAELFFPDADRDFPAVLTRSLATLQTGVRQFADQMRTLQSSGSRPTRPAGTSF